MGRYGGTGYGGTGYGGLGYGGNGLGRAADTICYSIIAIFPLYFGMFPLSTKH